MPAGARLPAGARWVAGGADTRSALAGSAAVGPTRRIRITWRLSLAVGRIKAKT